MTNARLMRLLQVVVLALIAIYIGLQIVRRGPSFSLFVAMLPILGLVGLLALKYPHFIGLVLIGIFYTNIDGTISIELQLHLAGLFFGACIFYYLLLELTRRPIPALNMPARLYFAFFIVTATMAALLPNRTDLIQYEWINSVALYGLNVFFLTYVVSRDPERLQKVVKVIVFAGVLLSVVNTIEFFDRSLINLSTVPGRSAGFLRNANPAAYSILACFIISYMTKVRFLFIYRILMFVGIYTTFTRAALLMFFVFLFYQEFLIQQFSMRRMVISLVTILGVVTFMSYGTFFLERSHNRHASYAYQRITAIQQGNFNDSSTLQRLRVIGINLQRFAQSPIVGNGAMSASGVNSPHNQFLLILAENGIVGFSIWVAFLGALLRRILRAKKGPERRLLLSLYFFLILNMFFSHNLYHIRFYIVLFAFLSAGAEVFAESAPEAAPATLPRGRMSLKPARAFPVLPERRFLRGGGQARRPDRGWRAGPG